MKLLILSALLVCVCAIGREQRVSVSGRLVCPSNPKKAHGITIKLVDDDTAGIDDLMARGKTDNNGRFQLSGTDSEIGRIDPRLKIYHDCKNWHPCKRYWKMEIPKKYINSGKTFNMGDVNLEMKMPGEEHDCIH